MKPIINFSSSFERLEQNLTRLTVEILQSMTEDEHRRWCSEVENCNRGPLSLNVRRCYPRRTPNEFESSTFDAMSDKIEWLLNQRDCGALVKSIETVISQAHNDLIVMYRAG